MHIFQACISFAESIAGDSFYIVYLTSIYDRFWIGFVAVLFWSILLSQTAFVGDSFSIPVCNLTSDGCTLFFVHDLVRWLMSLNTYFIWSRYFIEMFKILSLMVLNDYPKILFFQFLFVRWCELWHSHFYIYTWVLWLKIICDFNASSFYSIKLLLNLQCVYY